MATLTLRLDEAGEALMERAKDLSQHSRTGTGVIIEALQYFCEKEKHQDELTKLQGQCKGLQTKLERLLSALRQFYKIGEIIQEFLQENEN